MKNAGKRTLGQEQLAQVCSQIVSFFLFCVSLNFACFADNTIKNRRFSPKQQEQQKNNKVYKFQIGPSISLKLVQVCCAT